jgi:uncharacterized protein (TIGR03437 family)
LLSNSGFVLLLILKGMWRSTLPLLLMLQVALQAQSVPALQCVANAGVPPTLRTEGLTEEAGDIVLQCTGGQPTAKGASVPVGNLTVTFNTNITNRTLGNTPFADGLLMIDEPQPANQKLAATTAASTISPDAASQTGTGAGLSFQSGAIPNLFPGTLNNVNQISFAFPNDGIAQGTSRTFRITNVRVNASIPGSGSAAQVVAFISLTPTTGAPPVTVGSNLIVGNIQQSLQTNLIASSASGCIGSNPVFLNGQPIDAGNPPGGAAILSYKGRFPAAFKTPAQSLQNTPGGIYTTDGGFNYPGTSAFNFGTRLAAVFNNIPDGVRLFVSPTNIFSPFGGEIFDGVGARLIVPSVPSGQVTAPEVAIANHAAEVIWEILDRNALGQQNSMEFGVWEVWAGSLAAPTPGTATVNMSYAPISGSTAGAVDSSPTLIPRFLDTSVPRLMASVLSCGGTSTTLGNIPDSRPCYYPGAGGLFFPYLGNACAGGNIPALNLISNNKAVTPSFSVTADQGIGLSAQNLATQPLTGATPLSGNVFVTNAANATPGTYNPILTVTAPGANTLNIPFPVTVLPANNPSFLPSGFDDAGNYESGQAYPGQIYSIFGSNFGTSALALAALDNNGKLPTIVGNAQVTFDGALSPLLFLVNNQVAGVAPFGIAGKKTTDVQLIYNGVKSPVVTLPVGTSHISLLSANASGGGNGAILNADGTLNSPSNPAARGSVVTLFASYAGPLNVAGTDGRTTTSAPYPVPSGSLTVSMGGINAIDIKYFGNAPTLLESVQQINVGVPAGVQPGPSVPLIVTAGGATSQPWVTIAVK